MTDEKPDQTEADCNPPPETPADQPHSPKEERCDPWPETTPPEDWQPEKCEQPDCDCPGGPPADQNCLEDAIREQAKQIAKGERAKSFKAELDNLLTKANAARQEFTPAKSKTLRDEWKKQDGEIAELIRRVACDFPCWKCIIECYVCPLINELHMAEQWLYGDGQACTGIHNLYDRRYWWERELDVRQRRYDVIKALLAAWEKPAQTIEKALADDAKLIADANKTSRTDAKVVYDVFLKLVPMHLAIAPPASPNWTTAIGKEYTQFCGCDEHDPKYCCGQPVGDLSLRRRLIGPQPYLIDPNDYIDLICCLVTKRYVPAKDALAEADGEFKDLDAEIKAFKAQIDNGLKSFDKDARSAIPSATECCKGKVKKDKGDGEPPKTTAA